MVRGTGVAKRRASLVSPWVLGRVVCRYVLHLATLVSMDAQAVAASLGLTLQRYLHGEIGAA